MFHNPKSLDHVSLMVCTSAPIVTALQTCTALAMGQVFWSENPTCSKTLNLDHVSLMDGVYFCSNCDCPANLHGPGHGSGLPP